MTKKLENALRNKSKILSKMISYSRYKDQSEEVIKALSQCWKAEIIVDKPGMMGSDKVKSFMIQVKVDCKIPEDRLVYCTFSNSDFADAVLIPVEDKKEYKVKLLVSFSAQKALEAGGGFVLCHQKVKKLLMPFFREKNLVPLYIQSLKSNKSSVKDYRAFLLSIGIHLSLFAAALTVTTEGEELRKGIEDDSKKYQIIKSKPFIRLNYYDEDAYREESKDKTGEDRDLIKYNLKKNLKIGDLKELQNVMLLKEENWYQFYDPLMNARYLYGSQLYSEFKEFYEKFSFVNPKHFQKITNFLEHLEKKVESFKSVSAWSKFVTFD